MIYFTHKGLGFLFVLITVFIGLLGLPILTRLTIADPYFATNNYWIIGLSFFISGTICFVAGKNLDRKKHHINEFSIKQWSIFNFILGTLIILIFFIQKLF